MGCRRALHFLLCTVADPPSPLRASRMLKAERSLTQRPTPKESSQTFKITDKLLNVRQVGVQCALSSFLSYTV